MENEALNFLAAKKFRESLKNYVCSLDEWLYSVFWQKMNGKQGDLLFDVLFAFSTVMFVIYACIIITWKKHNS